MGMIALKKEQPVYAEMRTLAPYYFTLSGIYLGVTAALAFALGGDYTLVVGAVYGIILSALNFLLLGKSAQAAVKKADFKSAQTYSNIMYCVRYLGLFGLLTLAALLPFINLIAAAVPLFFVRIAITIREIKNERSERAQKRARRSDKKEE